MKPPLYSIIIPTYNSGKTLAACLDSIVQQTFRDYEVIIVDGLSTDHTVDIAIQYSSQNPRISWVSEKDKGIYDAMNKGIKMSAGEWIYFLGSDDYLLGNSVLEQLGKLVNLDDHDFVYGNVRSPEYGEQYDGEFDKNKMITKNICHQAIFTRRKVFLDLGFYNTRYPLLSDYDFNLRCMFSKQVRKKHVDLLIAYYAPNGASSTTRDKAFKKVKNRLLLKHGFFFYPWRTRIALIMQMIKQAFTAV